MRNFKLYCQATLLYSCLLLQLQQVLKSGVGNILERPWWQCFLKNDGAMFSSIFSTKRLPGNKYQWKGIKRCHNQADPNILSFEPCFLPLRYKLERFWNHISIAVDLSRAKLGLVFHRMFTLSHHIDNSVFYHNGVLLRSNVTLV